jgi:hypothetical protein
MKQYLNTAIDSVQYAKTQFLNTFVNEEVIREPLQLFVDAQAQFARQMVHASDVFIDSATKYDFAGAFEKAFKPFKSAV